MNYHFRYVSIDRTEFLLEILPSKFFLFANSKSNTIVLEIPILKRLFTRNPVIRVNLQALIQQIPQLWIMVKDFIHCFHVKDVFALSDPLSQLFLLDLSIVAQNFMKVVIALPDHPFRDGA